MSQPSSEPTPRERGPDEAFCRNCGDLISAQAELCPSCGVRQLPPPTSSLDSALDALFEGGNPFVAAVASALFPGFGQLYNRELRKGLAIMIGSLLALGSIAIFVGIVLFPAVWLYAIYDAYKTAERQAVTERPFPARDVPPGDERRAVDQSSVDDGNDADEERTGRNGAGPAEDATKRHE